MSWPNYLPHFVYEAFDADGSPLYVGCTVNFGTRLQTHMTSSEWFSDAASFQITRHPDRATALAVETERIKELKPAHNRKDNPDVPQEHSSVVRRRRLEAYHREGGTNVHRYDCEFCKARRLAIASEVAS